MEMEGESMAQKTDKQPSSPTLLVSVENQQQKQQPPRAARPLFLHIDGVQRVNRWTFLNAVAFIFSFGISVAYCHTAKLIVAHYPSLASWLLPLAGTKLTGGRGGVQGTLLASFLVIGILWYSTPQAAAGALALLLRRRRWRLRRRAAAYAALALTVASHCMFARAVLFFVRRDPEGLYFRIVGSAVLFACAVADLHGLLALLRKEWAN